MSDKYKNFKVKELQELLQKNDLPYTGKKEDLVERLVKLDERKAMESLEKEFALEDDFDESKLILSEDIPNDAIFSSLILDKPTYYEKESVLSDDEEELAPVVVEKKPASVSPTHSKAGTPPVTEPASSATTTVEITVQESVTETEVAPASSFKFTPITFESKTPAKVDTPKKAAPAKKSPASKTPAKKPSPVAASKSSNTKTSVSKASGSKIPAPKPSKSTAKVTPTPTKSVRPTRSTRTPLPKATKSTKATKAKSSAATTASLAIQEKKEPLTAEQIEKAKLEAERKLERSKRFGIKLDEKDMKEIRAARFGTIGLGSITATTSTTTTKEDKKKGGKQTTTATAAAEKKDAAQDILKKRAERFGIPEKKIAPVQKKTPVKANNTKNNNTKLNTVTKNQVKQGRVQKMGPKTVLPTKKAVLKTITKANVLNKKQTNITNRLTGTSLTQNKRAIINNRTTNATPQGRVVTIAPIRSTPVRQFKTSPRDIIINANKNIRRPTKNTRPVAKDIGNGRTVTVGATTSTTLNNKRRRGRGPESSHQPQEKKRRN